MSIYSPGDSNSNEALRGEAEAMAQAARLASRLQRELKMLQSDPPPGVSAWPSDGHSLTHLQAHIHGPDGTVYANGIFKLDILVPDRYPFEPPNIKFITPVYHPNIDNGGRICLDILNLPPKGAWRPSLNLLTLLASIGLLLAEPNPDDGLMGDITAEYKHDRLSFDMKARNWTELYASPDQVTSESKLPQTFSKAEPNEKNGTDRLHGQEQMQSSSSMENHMISNCSTSSQPIRAGPFLSKRLTLDRGTACLQDTKGATSAFSSQCKVSQVKRSLKKTTSFPPNQSEAASLHRKTEAQSLKELAMRELPKGEVALEASNSSICDGKKPPLHTEDNLINSCTDLRGEFSDDMATVKSNTALNATLSHVASGEVFSEAGICPQPDGCCSTSIPDCPEVLDAEKSNRRNLRITGQKCKSDFSAGKENQAPNCCPATTKPKEGHFKHPVAGKELSAEVSRPMEMSSLPSIHATLADNRVGKDRSSSLCLSSRTKSLKLARAKPDSNTLPASTIQQALPEVKQVILAEKKWSRPIVISDDVPTVVVSDSGSDSDEGFTLSLSQRNVCNKRKASSKLR